MGMGIKWIKKEIEEVGGEKIKEIEDKLRFGEMVGYEYEWVMYDEMGKGIGGYKEGLMVKGWVWGGKRMGFGMMGWGVKEMGLCMMIVGGEGDIVGEDSEEM